MRDYRKIIYDDVGHLFHYFELDKCEISKSVEPDREWDYILKLRMGKAIKHFEEPCRFGGFCTDKELYEDCIQDKRVKNNWMCWRDGIMRENQSLATTVRNEK